MVLATIRTVVFYAMAVTFTMVWAVISGLLALITPYPARYYLAIGVWARVMHLLVVCVLGIRVRVHGRENIPNQACVILSNHQSAWETYFLQLLFAPQSQVAKASLLKIPFFGWTFALMKPIAIDRSNRRQAMNQVVEQGIERISEGCSVLIFPEGTRSEPGRPLPFRRGGAVLAKAAGCKIVPVTHNSGRYFLNKQFAKLPGVIDIYIHPPMSADGDTAEVCRAVESVVVAQLEAMAEEEGVNDTQNSSLPV